MATSLALPAMRSCGHTLDEGDDKLGLLISTQNVFRNMDSARQRMQEDSYLLMRGLLDKDEVIAARRCTLEQLAAEGQLDPNAPLMHGVPKPGSRMTFPSRTGAEEQSSSAASALQP